MTSDIDLQRQRLQLLEIESKHLGPGPHPSGSPQMVHRGGGGGVQQLIDLMPERLDIGRGTLSRLTPSRFEYSRGGRAITIEETEETFQKQWRRQREAIAERTHALADAMSEGADLGDIGRQADELSRFVGGVAASTPGTWDAPGLSEIRRYASEVRKRAEEAGAVRSFDEQFADLVTLIMSTRRTEEKHGNHNQASHGNWATEAVEDVVEGLTEAASGGGGRYADTTPRTSAGISQGKGVDADRATIRGALQGWGDVEGDTEKLSERLDGWTHSKRHTADRLRDAKKAGEIEYSGSAMKHATTLHDRIRSQTGEVREEPLPEPDVPDAPDAGRPDVVSEGESLEDAAERWRTLSREAESDYVALHHAGVADALSGERRDEFTIPPRTRSAYESGFEEGTAKRREANPEEAPAGGMEFRLDGMPYKLNERGDMLLRGGPTRPTPSMHRTEPVIMSFGTPLRRGQVEKLQTRHAEYVKRLREGDIDMEKAREQMRLAQMQINENADEYDHPWYDIGDLIDMRTDRETALVELAMDAMWDREGGTLTLKVPSGSEVVVHEEAVLAYFKNRRGKDLDPLTARLEELIVGMEVKHGGPGPHSTGTPQLVHAVGGPRASAVRRRQRHQVTRKAREARGDGLTPMPSGKYPRGDPRNDPEYEAYVEEIEGRINGYLETNGDTFEQHSNPVLDAEGNPKLDQKGRPVRALTPERVRAHRQIVDDFIADAKSRQVPKEGKAWIMGGLPGAGKSYTISNKPGRIPGLDVDENGDPTNAVVINPDDAKTAIMDSGLAPEVEGLHRGEMASIIHEESSQLAKRIADAVLEEGFNVVFDITLGDDSKSKRKYVDPARRHGYDDFTAVFVDAEIATSLHWMGRRHKSVNEETGERGYAGRYVPYDLVLNESRPPKGSDVRSSNRASYDRLIQDDKIARAIRFDRETGEVYDDKGDG